MLAVNHVFDDPERPITEQGKTIEAPGEAQRQRAVYLTPSSVKRETWAAHEVRQRSGVEGREQASE
jgi:hypothetical protein